MNRPRGFVSRPPNTDPAPCYPSNPAPACGLCTRRRRGEPVSAEDRPALVVIDGSVLGPVSSCGMFAPRKTARHWTDTVVDGARA